MRNRERVKILYKFATTGRPQEFKNTLEIYYAKMSNLYDYQFIITVDNDDGSMNNQSVREYMDSKPNLSYFFGNSKTKVEAINADMRNVDFDILVNVSDDMIPIVDFFDEKIVELMLKSFPNLDGALHFNDGRESGSKKINTLSIIGRKLYDFFGYIYHPAYKSSCCDIEFTEVVRKLGKVIYSPEIIIRHKWGGNQGDKIYKKNYGFVREDKRMYCDRKVRGFPK